ncbi:Outer membrane porin protein precursor [compost metagenome]
MSAETKMKIRLSVVLGALSAPAFAQGSVTLYGVLDEGLNYTSNVGGYSMMEMASGFPHGSRWGLKGSEDLGGGVKAVFQLENGFDVVAAARTRAGCCSDGRPMWAFPATASARSPLAGNMTRWSISWRRIPQAAPGAATCLPTRTTTTT